MNPSGAPRARATPVPSAPETPAAPAALAELPVPASVLAVGAVLLWAVYFVVAYSPVGSVFVYATF